MFDILGAIAPTIGKAIQGNIGGAVEEALKAFGSFSGGKKELEKLVQEATPEQLIKLKQIDREYSEKLAQIGVDLASLEVQDRKSARDMYSTINTMLVPTLAVVIMLGAFLLTIALLFIGVPPSNKDILFMVMGVVVGHASNVVSFYFGSSQGSKLKNSLISELATKE